MLYHAKSFSLLVVLNPIESHSIPIFVGKILLNLMNITLFHGSIPLFLSCPCFAAGPSRALPGQRYSELGRGDSIVEVNGVRSVEGMLQKCKAPKHRTLHWAGKDLESSIKRGTIIKDLGGPGVYF